MEPKKIGRKRWRVGGEWDHVQCGPPKLLNLECNECSVVTRRVWSQKQFFIYIFVFFFFFSLRLKSGKPLPKFGGFWKVSHAFPIKLAYVDSLLTYKILKKYSIISLNFKVISILTINLYKCINFALFIKFRLKKICASIKLLNTENRLCIYFNCPFCKTYIWKNLHVFED